MGSNIVSLFSGAGGLDLGFEQAGFMTVWANEFDKDIWDTFRLNFPETTLDTRSIVNIPSSDIPDCVGLVGGPPCQSWSAAGAKRGIEDKRGQLFNEYIRVLRDKQPLFFVAENVKGMLSKKHRPVFDSFIAQFESCGYAVSWKLVNAFDYEVAQDRWRVIIVGVRRDLEVEFEFPEPRVSRLVLSDALEGLPEAVPSLEKGKHNDEVLMNAHEYLVGGFSSMFMSRNRVRGWDEPSFTIQAGGRHAPLHPQAPKMVRRGSDSFEFAAGREDEYRRLSIRECARIQSFPDGFEFVYQNVNQGYKMVGNAVPVELARRIAAAIAQQLGLGWALHDSGS